MRTPGTVLLLVLLFGACSSVGHDEARTGTNADALSTSITICGTPWATCNLAVSTYRNGDAIPHVIDPTTWARLTTGAWCWYNNDSSTYHRFGRLYNWYAVNDPRGLAPSGWHVLTDGEWDALETCLGKDSVGYRLRAAGQWPGPATAADNSSGFSGLPSGIRSQEGIFSHADSSVVYWTAVEGSVSESWCARLIHLADLHGTPAMVTGVGYMSKAEGYAVRCVKDR
jgi:uncharacterized protein (TIGR02145 family)